MTGQKRKRQHYVAQSVLERFTQDGDVLFVFDKTSQKTFLSNKRDVAHEKYFYDFPEDLISAEGKERNVDPQIMEKALGNIDGDFNSAIEDALKLSKRKTIPRELRERLAVGLAFQIFRTRDYRDLIIEASTKLRQAITDEIVSKEFPQLSKDHYPQVSLQQGHESLLHAQFMFDEKFLERFVSLLANGFWMLGVNRTLQVFYTSDTPVVKHHHINHPDFTGWQSPGTEIAFPLTPRLILIVYERAAFPHYKHYDGTLRPVYNDNVTFYNSLQVINSRRQVYSCANDFSLANRMCKEEPDLCNPNTDRVKLITRGELLGIHFLKK